MPGRAQRLSFIALHLTVVAVVLVQGMYHAFGERARDPHLMMLGSLELLAGVLFLFPHTMRYAGALIVALFGHMVLFEATHGDFATTPLVCAAAALFITLHGSVWRRRASAPAR